MEVVTINCKSCLAPAAIKNSQSKFKCEFCGSTNIIQQKPSKNFIVRAGGVSVGGKVGGSIITGNGNVITDGKPRIVTGNNNIIGE